MRREEIITELKNYISELDSNNAWAVMERPSLLMYDRIIIAYGKDLHNHSPEYSDGIYWYFPDLHWSYPEGVEEKLMDNIQYKVWYMERDLQNNNENTISYIEPVLPEKEKLRKELTNIINTL